MSRLAWNIVVVTIGVLAGYGLWKRRATQRSSASFLGGSRELRWWVVGLSVMVTQASTITFLSMPGQAHEDGMGFIQFYFGQPIAMTTP